MNLQGRPIKVDIAAERKPREGGFGGGRGGGGFGGGRGGGFGGGRGGGFGGGRGGGFGGGRGGSFGGGGGFNRNNLDETDLAKSKGQIVDFQGTKKAL